MTRLAFVTWLAAPCIFVAAAASQSPDPKPPVRFSDAAESTYAQLCATCHGARLEGGGQGPSLVDDIWIHGSSDADIARSIREGSPESGMPAFGRALSEEQIRMLVVYIREMSGGGHPWLQPSTLPRPSIVASEQQTFRIETVVAGLDTPWGLAFLPDGRLLVTDRVGLLRTVVNGVLDPVVIGGLPAFWVRQDGGLMDVAVHPDYADNGWIYLSFSEPGGSEPNASSTRIIRGRLRDHRLVDQESIFQAPPELYWHDNTHYGSRFIFDRDGYLYYSLGDRGRRDLAQDLSSPYGKIHRVDDDGGVPADNPFVDTPGAVGSIWTYGHRNPQGFAFHPVTGELWSSEHGPRGGDELNLIEKGKNYGWPVVTTGIDYDGTAISTLTEHEGMEPPVVEWTPTIAPAAILFYSGPHFPAWRHHLILTTLAGEHLRRLEVMDRRVTHQEVVFKELGRIRDVAMGPDGHLYLALNAPGRIVRLVPES